MQVTITQLQNGTTADAAAVDANFNALASAVNGNLDATNLAAGAVGDAQMASSVSVITRGKEALNNFVVSGLTMATSANLSTTLLAGTAYVNGKRVTISNTPITVSANKDTYIYLKDDGTVITANSVSNNTTSPTATQNSDGTNALLVGILVSSGTAITTSNQGSVSATAPVVSGVTYTVCDGLGNLIYPAASVSKLVGLRAMTAQQAGITTEATITALTLPVVVPAGRQVKLRLRIPQLFSSVNGDRCCIRIKDGSTYVQGWFTGCIANGSALTLETVQSPSAGTHTYTVTLTRDVGTGSVTFYADNTTPAIGAFSAELV